MESIFNSIKIFYDTKILGYFNTLVEYPIKILALLIDLAIVFYLIMKLVKITKGTRAVSLFKGIAVLLIANVLSEFLSLNILHYLLNSVITYGVFLVIVIFQPELRKTLEQMGSTSLKNFFDMDEDTSLESIDEVVEAVMRMSDEKTGALIVYEKEYSLGDYIHTGVAINSDISKELLMNIFVPDTPLHDGAVIIRENKIAAASCILPITNREDLEREFGTRHRAALGLSEITDAVIIIVSEETGKVSIATEGNMVRNLGPELLKKELRKRIKKSNIKDTALAQKMKELKKKRENK